MGYQITRPDTDQIKFTSSKTGNHILEEYLEDAEKGTKTLGELLDLLFNEDGSVRNFVAVDGLVAVANGGTGSNTVDGALSNLGFGQFGKTLATSEDASGARVSLGLVPGTTAGSMVQLDAQAKLPAVDGSQLTGITKSQVSGILSGFSHIAVFTSSGAWTVPADVTKCKVTVVGGGGGGGNLAGPSCGTYYWGGAGGGAGGATIKIVSGLTPGATVSVTVGAGGPGTNTGGTSSFGAHCSATGGTGGQFGHYPGVGGVGASGDINISGAPGTVGTFASNAISAAGTGGSSILGGGGRIAAVKAAQGFGGGGAGGDYTFNNAGGAGFAGVVVIEY